MEEKKDFNKLIEKMCEKDKRYKPDAYEFVMQALYFTQKNLKKTSHVTGGELSEGIRKFVVEQYGPMAKTVFSHWGITKTQDFGNIVYTMIEHKMLAKTETDSIDDFKDVYDFEAAFGNVFRDIVIKDI